MRQYPSNRSCISYASLRIDNLQPFNRLQSLLLQPLARLFVSSPVKKRHDFPYALIVMVFQPLRFFFGQQRKVDQRCLDRYSCDALPAEPRRAAESVSRLYERWQQSVTSFSRSGRVAIASYFYLFADDDALDPDPPFAFQVETRLIRYNVAGLDSRSPTDTRRNCPDNKIGELNSCIN